MQVPILANALQTHTNRREMLQQGDAIEIRIKNTHTTTQEKARLYRVQKEKDSDTFL